MALHGLLDDETIEAIISGDEVDARFDAIVAFAWGVRRLGEGPAPNPSRALEAVFAGEVDRRRSVARRGWNGPAAKVAGLGLAAKVALGTSLAAAGVVAAGAGGALPGPVTERVRDGIEAVTPARFGHPESERDGTPAEREQRSGFGDRVSGDATGADDGEPGVDGREIRDEAPGAEVRRGGPGTGGRGGAGSAGASPVPSTVPDVPDLPDDAGEAREPGAGVDPGAPGPGSAPGATAPGAPVSPPTSLGPAPSTDVPSTTVPSAPTTVPRGGGSGASSSARGG